MKLQYGPYSPSRLTTAACGYAFKRQYLDKDPTAKTENLPQARGSAAHLVFEQITRRMCEDKSAKFTDAELRSLVNDAMLKHPAAYQETALLLQMARLYIERPPEVLTTDAGVELHLGIKFNGSGFEECAYDDPEAFARGRADIMVISDDTTMARIYDHKTSVAPERSADTFQMGFYAWVVKKIHPYLDRVETVIHNSRYGSYTEPYVWTSEELAKVEDIIRTMVDNVESRTEFTAQAHDGCQYCPFVFECPIFKDQFTEDESGAMRLKPGARAPLGSQADAVATAQRLEVLGHAYDHEQKRLKAFCETYGTSIAIPGKIYELRASEPKIDWDTVNKKLRAETYAIYEKHGVDPKDYMVFSQSSTARLWMKEDEGLLKELNDIYPRRVETRFGGYKA